MRLAKALLLLNARVACAFLLAGCELVLDPNSLVGKNSTGSAGHTSSAGDTASAGHASAEGGDQSGGTAAGGGSSAGTAGSDVQGGANSSGGKDGQAGMPGQNGDAGSGTAPACKITNKGKEICDGVDNDCDPATPDCPANCSFVSAASVNYMACDQLARWQSAQLACFQQSMQLVTISGGKQNAALLAELQSLGFGPYVWLAADDTDGNGALSWPDGTVLANGSKIQAGVYQNFGAGEPAVTLGGSGRCLQLDTSDGAWSTTFCSDTQQFVCGPFGVTL